MATKYHTRWAEPCTVGRKTLDVYSREGLPSHAPSTPLVLGPKRRRLTSAKEVLYNPCLPTLRRMDMDDVSRKLTDEHSRHSTPCSRDDFRSSTITLFRPADKSLSGTRITETGRQLQSTSYQPIESGGMAEFLKRSMTSQSQKQPSPLPPNEPSEPFAFMPEPYLKYSADQMKFNGYATRYLSPRETGSWRYSLRQEPYIDTRGQRPIPATIYSRYRDAHPRASVRAMHWR
ncbi:sperm microtubule inner protein 8-like isoform X1 [Oculina patagonica]